MRRANQGSAFDRIIDFGNDAPSKGNIVINFQGGLSYESHDDVGGKQLITASLKGPAHPRAVAAAAASAAADPSSSSSSSSSPTGPTFPAQQWTHVHGVAMALYNDVGEGPDKVGRAGSGWVDGPCLTSSRAALEKSKVDRQSRQSPKSTESTESTARRDKTPPEGRPPEPSFC